MPNTDSNTALLVMDVQPGIVERISDKGAYLARAKCAVDHAHANDIRVIYVVVAFRPGAPDSEQARSSSAFLFFTLRPLR